MGRAQQVSFDATVARYEDEEEEQPEYDSQQDEEDEQDEQEQSFAQLVRDPEAEKPFQMCTLKCTVMTWNKTMLTCARCEKTKNSAFQLTAEFRSIEMDEM